MRNVAEGWDYLMIHGLAGLPVASQLQAILVTQAEADITPDTSTHTSLTQVGTTVVAAAALTSSSRIVNLGALDFSAVGDASTVKAVAVLTDTPANSGKLVAIQDLNGGAALGSGAATGGVIIDGLSIKDGYLASGSIG